MSLAESLKDSYPVNIMYIDKLFIEKNDRFGITVLYIPDELNHDNADTLRQVKELLIENNLTQVDIAIMHGQFEYQIPEIAKPHIKHNLEEYEKIVKYFISIGHVHMQSNMGKAYAQGSPDRLRHGEEEDKGFYRFNISDKGVKAEFVINKNARTFKTFKFAMNDTDELISQLDNRLKNIRPDSFIRVLVNKDHPVLKKKDILDKRYPTINFTVDTLEKKVSKKTTEVIEDYKVYEPIIITRNTIATLLRDRISMTDNSLVNTKLNEWIERIPNLK